MRLSEPLETKRLSIRQLTQEDYGLLLDKLDNASSKEEYPTFSYYKKRDVDSFLIQTRESHQIVGYIFLRTYESAKTVECYYALFPRYTGNGYAIEALRKIFDYVFENDEFGKIVAHVEQGNVRGWKVAERSGMKYMGDIFHEGKDSKVMSFLITKIDYLKQFQ
jgi:RimJ/RimL family protein N-acetyltransferase